MGFVSGIIIPILFIGCVAIIMILRSKRKREITEVIEQWNRTEGVPKGIYFALGSDNGISPDDFWLGVYPRRIRVGRNSHIVVTTNPLIHLYMNPSTRQEWCRQNGVEFLYPQQQQRNQHQPQQQQYFPQQQQYGVPVQPPIYSQNYGQGPSEQQPPPYQEVTDVKY